MNLVAAVLAAGASRRLGQPKQLVTFRGIPLVQRALDASALPRISSRAVILGANATRISEALPTGIPQVVNDAWDEGIASSIRVAVDWARSQNADGLVVLLVDQPLVDASHIDLLIDAWRDGHRSIAASHYAGSPGAPAIFSSRMFDALTSLRGDRGAGGLLRMCTDMAVVPCEDAAIDVDTESDLSALER